MDEERPAHYLRFARALALVSMVSVTSGCQQVRDRIGCEHCHCGGGFSMHTPVQCETIGMPECCMPVEGPLPPPELPTLA